MADTSTIGSIIKRDNRLTARKIDNGIQVKRTSAISGQIRRVHV